MPRSSPEEPKTACSTPPIFMAEIPLDNSSLSVSTQFCSLRSTQKSCEAYTVTFIESAGLGIKYQYNITNPLRIEPSFNYFFENDNVSMLDLNVNFHYLCPVAQSVKLYPLFGLTMSNWMFDMHDLDVDWDGDHVHVDDGGNHNEFRIGVNLGAGAEFALGRNWAMNVEFRYQLVDDFDQGVINFGAAYRF